MPLNIDFQQIFLHLLNFVILFSVLYFLLYAPVKKFMDSRTEYYKSMDEEAKANLNESENVKSEYAAKLKSADTEIEQKKKEAYQAIAEEKAKKLDSAKEEAEKIVSEACVRAEDERTKILKKAQSEVSQMVIDAMEKVVLQSDTAESYEKFLDTVERGGGNNEQN